MPDVATTELTSIVWVLAEWLDEADGTGRGAREWVREAFEVCEASANKAGDSLL